MNGLMQSAMNGLMHWHIQPFLGWIPIKYLAMQATHSWSWTTVDTRSSQLTSHESVPLSLRDSQSLVISCAHFIIIITVMQYAYVYYML